MGIIQITPQFRKIDTHTSQTLDLDGVRFRLDTYTNKNDGRWYFDVFSDSDVALVQGVGVVTGLDLLFPYHYLPIPPGVLFVQDQSGKPYLDPELDDFIQGDMALFYQEVFDA
jgi:hypothetical protein